jgi:hypothetical protein
MILCPLLCGPVLRDHPAAQNYLARLQKKHDQGKAFTVLAQKLARAVYYRLTRKVAFDTKTFFQRYGRGADEPAASRDNQGCTAKRRAKVLDALRRCTPRCL